MSYKEKIQALKARNLSKIPNGRKMLSHPSLASIFNSASSSSDELTRRLALTASIHMMTTNMAGGGGDNRPALNKKNAVSLVKNLIKAL